MHEVRAAEHLMGKKIWSYASKKVWFWENRLYRVCPYIRPPLHVSQGEILHFKYLRVSAVNRIATRTFRDKKNNKADSFFRLNFEVYIGVDNRERARARYKNAKETNFILRITWKFYSSRAKMRNARSHQG